jgi:ankyrin repeat protein
VIPAFHLLSPPSQHSWRPLHKAVSEDFSEGIRILLEAGADSNAQDEVSCSPPISSLL